MPSQTTSPNVLFKTCPSLPWVEMRHAFNSSACYQPHSHDEFSFGVIDQGSATYVNANQHYTTHEQSSVWINPGEVHACNPQRVEWSYRMLFVEAAWLMGLQNELSDQSYDYQPFEQSLNVDKATYTAFDQLFFILETETNRLVAESSLILFLSEHLSLADQMGSVAQPLKQVRELLMDNLDKNLELAELSQVAGLSRYQLLRGFKQSYGLAPHAYQLDQRIKQAKHFLKKGCSLSDTALRLGFADQAHFQRHFKQRVAITPKEYQRCLYLQPSLSN